MPGWLRTRAVELFCRLAVSERFMLRSLLVSFDWWTSTATTLLPAMRVVASRVKFSMVSSMGLPK